MRNHLSDKLIKIGNGARYKNGILDPCDNFNDMPNNCHQEHLTLTNQSGSAGKDVSCVCRMAMLGMRIGTNLTKRFANLQLINLLLA